MSNDRELMCPSVPPHYPNAVAFGVVGGTVESPELIPLIPPQPVTPELLELAAPVYAAEVFRFAATCAKGACKHWEESSERCRLVARTVQFVPSTTEKLKPCAIRPTCRWFKQEGKAACIRCPQLASSDPARSEAGKRAAMPDREAM